MSNRTAVLLCVLLLTPTSCNGDVENTRPEPTAIPTETQNDEITFAPAKVLIDTAGGSVLIDAELAETDVERQRGLMFRESLDDEAGMMFVYQEETTGGYYMKNTLIPLSIAFIDKDSRIVSILDMDPCEADPCPIYDPGLAYVAALEVNQGAFAEWGVKLGDRVTVTR